MIIALTGARLSEVTGMNVVDVAQRHGVQTFYLAREQGKTEESRRIIPIPKKIIELGFVKYQDTRPKNGPLFDGINPKIMSQTYSRWRADLGLTRKGCDIHAFRHHLKTLLRNVSCPTDVNDYLTGHAADNVGATYGNILSDVDPYEGQLPSWIAEQMSQAGSWRIDTQDITPAAVERMRAQIGQCSSTS